MYPSAQKLLRILRCSFGDAYWQKPNFLWPFLGYLLKSIDIFSKVYCIKGPPPTEATENSASGDGANKSMPNGHKNRHCT